MSIQTKVRILDTKPFAGVEFNNDTLAKASAPDVEFVTMELHAVDADTVGVKTEVAVTWNEPTFHLILGVTVTQCSVDRRRMMNITPNVHMHNLHEIIKDAVASFYN